MKDRKIRTFVLVVTETTDDYGDGPRVGYNYTLTRPDGCSGTSLTSLDTLDACIDRLREAVAEKRR